MESIEQIKQKLSQKSKTWLVTGVAGFIGTNLLETLLGLNQKVIGIDNFSSGKQSNLKAVKQQVSKQQWHNFTLHNADITDQSSCGKIFQDSKPDNVLHHAAISSVPFSLQNPELVKLCNVNGFHNILQLCYEHQVAHLVYASSSAVYGDNNDDYKTEERLGKMLSPYAVSKWENEKLAEQLFQENNYFSVGLRYFNVYGRYQDPHGGYAAVIPKWIDAVLANKQIYINGDGSTTRDFCSVHDIVNANLLACYNSVNTSQLVYNIGSGMALTLNELYNQLILTVKKFAREYKYQPEYRKFINGDIRHSCANIKLAGDNLGFYPVYTLDKGLRELIGWHLENEE